MKFFQERGGNLSKKLRQQRWERQAREGMRLECLSARGGGGGDTLAPGPAGVASM